jgi:GNAT superfamily N-acetyltransferase
MSLNNEVATDSHCLIRPCGPGDAVTLVELIRELARFEDLEAFARATPDQLRTHLFGPRPLAEALVAEVGGTAVGYAIYFMTFSTFRGRPGVYVEDLYVRPEHRGRGIGSALLASVAGTGKARGGCRLEWSVLNWNSPAIAFYELLGARPLDAWTVYRLDGEPFDRLAERTASFPPTSDAGTTAG